MKGVQLHTVTWPMHACMRLPNKMQWHSDVTPQNSPPLTQNSKCTLNLDAIVRLVIVECIFRSAPAKVTYNIKYNLNGMCMGNMCVDPGKGVSTLLSAT